MSTLCPHSFHLCHSAMPETLGREGLISLAWGTCLVHGQVSSGTMIASTPRLQTVRSLDPRGHLSARLLGAQTPSCPRALYPRHGPHEYRGP